MEALGTAAGVVGIVSLAVQVAHSARKLHDFWGDAISAPEDVGNIKSAVSLIGTILEMISTDFDESLQLMPDKATGRDAVTHCVGKINQLTALTSELERDLKRPGLRGKLAPFGSALRKREMLELRSQLQSDVVVLSLVMQSLFHRSERQYMKEIMSKISTLQLIPSAKMSSSSDRAAFSEDTLCSRAMVTGATNGYNASKESADGLKCIRRRFIKGRPESETLSVDLGIGIFAKCTLKIRRHSPDDPDRNANVMDYVTRFQFTPRSWFCQRGLALNLGSATSGWTYTLKLHYVLPSNAPIFLACINGDMEMVKLLFSNKLATPFDRTVTGETLLHMAAQIASPELCKLLIEEGVDIHAIDENYRTALHVFVGYKRYFKPNTKPPDADVMDTMRALVQLGQIDPMLSSRFNRIATADYDGPPEAYRWLIQQDAVSVDPNQVLANGHPLIFQFLRHETLPRYKIQTLLEAGADVHYIQCNKGKKYRQTPLTMALENNVVDEWLDILKASSFDLKAYALREQHIFPDGLWVSRWYTDEERVMKFELGPKSDDLKVWWEYPNSNFPPLHLAILHWLKSRDLSSTYPFEVPERVSAEIRNLVASGADVHQVCDSGETPLDIILAGKSAHVPDWIEELFGLLVGHQNRRKFCEEEQRLHAGRLHPRTRCPIVFEYGETSKDAWVWCHYPDTTPLHELLNTRSKMRPWRKKAIASRIRSGDDLHAQDGNGMTVLDIALSNEQSEVWLEILSSLVDLQLYAEREEELHPGGIYEDNFYNRRPVMLEYRAESNSIDVHYADWAKSPQYQEWLSKPQETYVDSREHQDTHDGKSQHHPVASGSSRVPQSLKRLLHQHLNRLPVQFYYIALLIFLLQFYSRGVILVPVLGAWILRWWI